MAKSNKIKTSPERIAKDEKAKALGAICYINVDDDGIEKTLYFRKPHRKIIGLYYKNKESDEFEAAGKLLNGCVIAEVSDMDILSAERDDLWYSAIMEKDIILGEIKLKKSTSSTL